MKKEKKVEEKEQNEEENKSFLKKFISKYKTDKKYSAKIQLIGYGILIAIAIIYVNIASMTNSSTNSQTEADRKELIDKINNKEVKNKSLLETIDDNYAYKIDITYNQNKEEQTKKIHYEGKSSKDNIEIIKEIDNNKEYYYKSNTKYYIKENDSFKLIKEESIYDVVEKDLIEWNSLKKYINKASLDHVTDYSSGKKETVYHLKIKDVLLSTQNQDEIEITIEEENNILTIKADYTKLIKELSNDITECSITYTYTNIGEIEEIKMIEEQNIEKSE